MSNTHNKISTWAQEHGVETQDVIDFLAQNGKPGMKASQNIPQDVLKKVEERFKPADPPNGDDKPTDPPKDGKPAEHPKGDDNPPNPPESPNSPKGEGEKNQGTNTDSAASSVQPGKTPQTNPSSMATALLNQKPVVSGTMTEEELKKFTTSSQPQKPTAIDATEIVKAKIAAAIAAKRNVPATAPAPVTRLEPVPCANLAKSEPTEYVFDPHPAWGYAATAAGGAGLLFLLIKLFGGK